MELIGRAIAAGGGTAERHRRRALAFQTLGAFAEAEADYRAALRFNADDVEALGNLGVVLLGQGKAVEAAETTAKAARLQPAWAGLHANLGLALQAAGLAGDTALRRALALDPALAEAWNGLASSSLAAERAAPAETLADRALRLRPGYPEALSNRGVALLALHQPREAVAALRAALNLRPDDARTRWRRRERRTGRRWPGGKSSCSTPVRPKDSPGWPTCGKGNSVSMPPCAPGAGP